MSASSVGKNKFCKLRNLKNESDVEQNFIVRFLDDLEFTDDYRETKTSLNTVKIDKGSATAKLHPRLRVFSRQGAQTPGAGRRCQVAY